MFLTKLESAYRYDVSKDIYGAGTSCTYTRQQELYHTVPPLMMIQGFLEPKEVQGI